MKWLYKHFKQEILKGTKMIEIRSLFGITTTETTDLRERFIIETLKTKNLDKAVEIFSCNTAFNYKTIDGIAEDLGIDLLHIKEARVLRLLKIHTFENKEVNITNLAARTGLTKSKVEDIRIEQIVKPYILKHFPKKDEKEISKDLNINVAKVGDCVGLLGLYRRVETPEYVDINLTNSYKKMERRIEELKTIGIKIGKNLYRFIKEYDYFLLFESSSGVRETLLKNAIFSGTEKDNIYRQSTKVSV